MNSHRKPLSAANALYRAAALCSKSEQAEADIRTKLKNWGVSNDDADSIVARLIEERYLDENRYVHAFCRDKFRFSGWGRVKIAYALRQKGFSAAIIDEATAEIGEDDYADTLARTLASKMRSLDGKEPMQVKASLYRFAASRGFEPNLIFPQIEKIIKDVED